MKLLLSLCFLTLLTQLAIGQTQQSTPTTYIYFAQCHFDIQDQQEMLAFEELLRANPETDRVRLDWHTQRALITTAWTSDFTEADLREWFGTYESTLNCIQVGILGVDEIDPYPFTNCQN